VRLTLENISNPSEAYPSGEQIAPPSLCLKCKARVIFFCKKSFVVLCPDPIPGLDNERESHSSARNVPWPFSGRRVTYPNDNQDNDTPHNGTQQLLLNAIMLNVIILRVIVLNAIRLSVIMLSVITLNVIMLSAIILNVITLAAITLNAIMLSFITLSVV
jgi:hypothetical protein